VLLDSIGAAEAASTLASSHAPPIEQALNGVATGPRSTVSALSALALAAAIAAVVALVLLGALGELHVGPFGRFVR
jgi:hypothetical protein